MRYTSKVLMGLAASAMLAAIGAGRASATVINVDFNVTNVTPATGLTYSGLGAAPDSASNTFWTGLLGGQGGNTATGTNLLASDGVTLTGVTATGHGSAGRAGNGTQETNSSLLEAMLNDALESGDNSGTFSFTNLPLNTDYTVYLYNGAIRPAHEQFGTKYTVTGGNDGNFDGDSILDSTTMTRGFNNTTLVQGNNYAVFTGNTGATGVVSGTFDSWNLSGMQISFESSPAPEPASLGLLGLGGLALLARRRK